MYHDFLHRKLDGHRYLERPSRVLHRSGKRDDFLEKHRAHAAAARTGRKDDHVNFCAQVLSVVADDRMLHLAYEQSKRRNHRTSADWDELLKPDDPQLWPFLRMLKALITEGKYRPLKSRSRQIPKENGGARTLQIQKRADRVVASAAYLALEPWFDPILGDRVWGSRRGRHSAWGALAQAIALSDRNRAYVWYCNDLKDAFDNVPHVPLLETLSKRLMHDRKLMDFLRACIGNKEGRGLRQGNPLSPLLLNVYLSHSLDHRWQMDPQNAPLIRYVDDLVILCRSREKAEQVDGDLRNKLPSIGMNLKIDEREAIRAVRRKEEPAKWLGFEVRREGDRWKLSPDPERLQRLQKKFEDLHRRQDAALLAPKLIKGWVGYYGPCFEDVNRSELLAQVRECAHSVGFTEIPSDDELLKYWEDRHKRWSTISKDAREREYHRDF